MPDTPRDDAASGAAVPAGSLPAEVAPPEVIDAELVPPATTRTAVEETGYTASGVPTFDHVRDKIENRFGTADGAAELAAATPEGRGVEERYEARQRAAAERLARIRSTMHDDRTGDA